MNIAVLSLTRDRLDYTKHCFASLYANAGCEFDHFVTDQGSEDGTVEWLTEHTDATVYAYPENIGIVPALNAMLDDLLELADYDVVVKVDNDCELVTPNTLRDIAARSLELNALLSPHIRGLRQPPQPVGSWNGVSVTPVVGGIFCAAPARIFKDGYRHPLIPTLDGEDFNLCVWGRNNGLICGYVDGYEAWHYRGTDQQHIDFPDYFARRQRERDEAAGKVAA